jgi:hypothetical protein
LALFALKSRWRAACQQFDVTGACRASWTAIQSAVASLDDRDFFCRFLLGSSNIIVNAALKAPLRARKTPRYPVKWVHAGAKITRPPRSF